MPKYRITAPDGKTYEIEGPPGATREQVIAKVQEKMQAAPAPAMNNPAAPSVQAPPAEPSLLDRNMNTVQGAMEGLQQGAMGMGQTALQGGPGGMIGRKVAQMLGADPNNPNDILARVSDQIGHRAGMSRRQFDQTAAGQSFEGQGGAIVGQVAPALAIPGGGATLPARMLTSALGGAASTGLVPVEGGNYVDEKGKQAGLGALLGGGSEVLASGAKALGAGAVSRLETEAQKLAIKAKEMGIPLSMRQLTENPMARTMLSQLERLPFSGGGKRAEMENEAFSRAVGSTFGATGKKLTQEAFAAAKQRLSNTFEALTERNALRLTPQTSVALKSVRDEVSSVHEGAAKMVTAKLNTLLAMQKNGVVSGKAYQALDSEIGDLMKGGGYEGHYLGKLRDALRAGMDRSIAPADQAKWKAVRQAWANMKTVEPLVAKGATGELSPAALMDRITSSAAAKIRSSVGGGGDLQDLAKIGKKFLRASPDAGTADRALINRIAASATNVGAAGGLYGAQSTGLISPEQAAIAGAALAGNRYGLKALNSKALTQGGSTTLRGLAGIASPLPKLLPPAVIANWNEDKP